jgi:TRAP-type C4-dicarboxylate transport system permease small subunit
MHKINPLLVIVTIFLAFVGLLGIQSLKVYADPFSQSTSQNEACQGISAGSSTNPCSSDSGSSLGKIISDIINLLSLVLGAVAVIMIIIGGFKYVTSGGDTNSVASAKNTIIYAIIGIVLAAVGQVLVHFVLTTAQTAVNNSSSSPQTTTPPVQAKK